MDVLRSSRTLFRAALGALALILGSRSASAQGASEYQVKGAYLFKFGDYVEWPPGALPPSGGPFTIGILGQDPFGHGLDGIVQGRTVQGRRVVLRRLYRVEQAEGVQVLFIGPGQADRGAQILAALRGKSILTVADDGQGPGSILTFVLQDNKVRFAIDAGAAERAGLKLSSKLLSLALAVKRSN
ncbi:MAG TPA: YfiR family protein [Holophagaceae bacterium]|nr:YfiR family protein [Holophagaceae bacterium]